MRSSFRAVALSAALISVPGSLRSPEPQDHRSLHHAIDTALFEGDLNRAGVLLANAWGSLPRDGSLELVRVLPSAEGTGRTTWLLWVLAEMAHEIADPSTEPSQRRCLRTASDRLRSSVFTQVASRNAPLDYLRDLCALLEGFGPPTNDWISAYEPHFPDWKPEDRDDVVGWMRELNRPEEATKLLAAWEVTHPKPVPPPPTDWEAIRLDVLRSDEAIVGDIDEVIELCNRLADAGRTEELRQVIARVFEADYGDFLLIWNAYLDGEEQILPEVRRYVEAHLPELLPDVLIELLEFTEDAPDPIEFGPDHPAHLEVRRLLIERLRADPESFDDTGASSILETLLPSVLVHGWPEGIDEALEALTLHLAAREEDPTDRASVLHLAGSVCFDHGRHDLSLGLLERAAKTVSVAAEVDAEDRAWYRRSLELARLGISPDYAP